jgi:hypothetical protein
MDDYYYIFLEYILDGNGERETIGIFTNWDDELERWAKTIKENPIVKDLEDFIKKEIHSADISDEERDSLYLRYLEMSLALFDRCVELAKTFARPNYPTVVA